MYTLQQRVGFKSRMFEVTYFFLIKAIFHGHSVAIAVWQNILGHSHLGKSRYSRHWDRFCFCHQLLEAPTRAGKDEENEKIMQMKCTKYRKCRKYRILEKVQT